LVLEAVQTNGAAYEFVSAELRSDLEIAAAAVGRGGDMLRFVPVEVALYKRDAYRELVLTAVRISARALQWCVGEELQGDPELMLISVRQEGWTCPLAHAGVAEWWQGVQESWQLGCQRRALASLELQMAHAVPGPDLQSLEGRCTETAGLIEQLRKRVDRRSEAVACGEAAIVAEAELAEHGAVVDWEMEKGPAKVQARHDLVREAQALEKTRAKAAKKKAEMRRKAQGAAAT